MTSFNTNDMLVQCKRRARLRQTSASFDANPNNKKRDSLYGLSNVMIISHLQNPLNFAFFHPATRLFPTEAEIRVKINIYGTVRRNRPSALPSQSKRELGIQAGHLDSNTFWVGSLLGALHHLDELIDVLA